MRECPRCNGSVTETVYESDTAFVYNRENGFKLAVALCNDCGFVFQASAYTDAYDGIIEDCYRNYDKSKFFPFPNRSQENIQTLDLILRHIDKNAVVNILEIGSNRGDMLHMIKSERPHVNVLGVEPTRYDYPLSVPTIGNYFSPDVFSNKFDFIIMQHVLEHIKHPGRFIDDLRRILSTDGKIYVETPNLRQVLHYCLDDFVVDHVNYFDMDSLQSVLSPYTLIDSDDKSFLRTVFKSYNNESKTGRSKMDNVMHLFSLYQSNRKRQMKRIIDLSKAGKTIVFYGVSFYFRLLMKELHGKIDIRRCFYFDNNYTAPYESGFGLKRLPEFNRDCVVIICSNNFTVQDAIADKIPENSVLEVIKPWRP